jgi:DNA repair exonuclease SbcCD ATPase subunit
MDAHPTQPDSTRAESTIARALDARRERMQALATARRERLGKLEADILERLDAVAADLDGRLASSHSRGTEDVERAGETLARTTELTERATELDKVAADLDHRAAALAAHEATCAGRQAELEARAQQIDVATAQLRQDEQIIVGERQAAAQELAQLRARAEGKLAELDQAQVEVAAQQTRTRSQRRQIAEQLQRERIAQRQAVQEQLRDAEKRLQEAARCEAEVQRVSASAAVEQEAAAKRHAEQQQELARQQAECQARKAENEAAVAKLRQDQRAVVSEQQAARDELTLLKKRVEERLLALDQDLAEVAAEHERTRVQRRRIAEQLRNEREAHRQEVNERLVQLAGDNTSAQSSHDALLADARREGDRLREQLRLRGDDLAAEAAVQATLRAELAQAKTRIDESMRDRTDAEARATTAAQNLEIEQARTAELQHALEDLRGEIARDAALSNVTAAEDSEAQTRALAKTAALVSERDSLLRHVAEAEAALALAQQAGGEKPDAGADRELADLTQRYEMAVRDIRDLKKQNEELSKKATSGVRTVAVPGQPMDWEARKRQLLESLEQDNEDQDEARRAERLQIESVILTTDSTLREKQEEIEELKRRLEEQGEAEGAMPVVRAAPAPSIDSHELVQERLAQLEAEWEQKLRQAEVDISLQRAQLARTRAEIDERQRTLDEHGARHDANVANDPGGKSKKAPRGRWLSRLGLQEDEQ